MRVKTTQIDTNFLIRSKTPKPDFEDCYTITFQTNNLIDLDTTVYNCFSVLSGVWIDKLFRLRNILVKPFKLRTSSEEDAISVPHKKIVSGGKISFFDVLDVSPNEVLMYANDSHLNAYFSVVLIQKSINKSIIASTTVKFNNAIGKIYFAFIKPFHKIIIKTMLRKVANELSKN